MAVLAAAGTAALAGPQLAGVGINPDNLRGLSKVTPDRLRPHWTTTARPALRYRSL